MGYNNEPAMPDKYLYPDGSIKTFAGVVYAAADDDRADIYKRMQLQAAKWLMPDGSIVAAIPISTESLDLLFVPLTRTINGYALSANIALTADDIGIPNPLVYKGVIDCSGNPNYPAANSGETYIASVAGKIGGASGATVGVGDLIICKVDDSPSGDQATVGANWNVFENKANEGDIAVIFHNATAETTPLDADEFSFYKTTVSALRKVTWANIVGTLKPILKSYFDTIYPSHALATAANDFLVASGAGAFVKKTLAEMKIIIGDLTYVNVDSSRNILESEMKGQVLLITGAYTPSLPTCAEGLSCTMIATTATVFSGDLVTGTDVIILAGQPLTAGNKFTSDGTIYAAIDVMAVNFGGTYKYVAIPIQGLFIDGGA